MRSQFKQALQSPVGNQGCGLEPSEITKEVEVKFDNGDTSVMKTGAIAIAAITSCTNTSNPYVMLGAGLLAKKAVEKGLEVPKYVKNSLPPGSKVVIAYLRAAGLMPYMSKLGFDSVGYGCTT